MSLAPSRVSVLLRTKLPHSGQQAEKLLDALGAKPWEKQYGLNLLEVARSEQLGHVSSRSRRGGRDREPSPLYAEVAQSVVPAGGLRGRARELDELAAFCADENCSYLWWQAEAWAGKTALLASFIVDPPPGVVPVSFFVTGRLAGQNTSLGFLRDVTAQLEALAGTSEPEAVVHEGVPHLHGLLHECARLLSDSGRRLVLVVDGLDEDASRAVGRQSVAAMIPKHLGHGGKVIVSGRPNPRLPGDTPADHPLWDPRIVRVLRESEYAVARKEVAAAELDQLLDSEPGLARDTVGYLLAARGGLSMQDIAELTQKLPRDVNKVFNSATGRTFAPRPVITTRGARDPSYTFSHDELFREAKSQLGSALIRDYREKLHEWAEGYRDRGWPEDTPFYLLRGYGEMLQQEQDGRRFIVLAADGTRGDRMLEVTGTDADAAAEADAAFELAATSRSTALADIARLAFQRERLADRNRRLPARLPAAWARAGHRFRAEALARSITAGGLRVEALALVSVALNDAGDSAGAGQLKDAACGEFQDVDREDSGYESAAGAVAAALARAGEPARAQAVLADLGRAHDEGLMEVAACLGKAALPEQAEAAAATATAVEFRAMALACAAGGLASAGLPDEASRLIREAEELTREIDDAGMRDSATWAAARAAAMAGKTSHAEELAASLGEPGERGRALADVAAVLAAPARRGLIMRLVTDASALFDEAETSARGEAWYSRRSASRDLAQAHAGVGEISAAEELARLGDSVGPDADCLIGIAEKLASVGETAEAERILARAENSARGGSPLRVLGEAVIKVAGALTALGAAGRAAEILSDLEGLVTGPCSEEMPLRDLANALSAADAIERGMTVARLIDDPEAQRSVMMRSAGLLARAGHSSRALEIASRCLDPDDGPWECLSLIEDLAKAQDFDQAEKLAGKLADDGTRSRALESVTVACAEAEQWAPALSLLQKISDQQARDRAITGICAALARAQRVDQALELSGNADEGTQARVLAKIVQGIAQTGNAVRAMQLARTLTHPWWRIAALSWIADAVAATDARAQAEILDETDELLTRAERSDEEASISAQERGRREGRIVIWLGSDGRHTACRAASTAFACGGQFQRAKRAAGLIPHPKSSRRALEAVAVAMARAGHAELAASLAATGSFRNPRAQVQARVAAALAHADHHTRARDLLVTVIRTGRWESWLQPLGEVSMPDLLGFAESLHREFHLAALAATS